MTPEMVDRARATARNSGVTGVEFRLGEIEHLPVADASVGVVLSNCVINLSTDKRAVYAEAFRVLAPGGRLAVSDVVATRPIPEPARRDPERWSSCSSGAIAPGRDRATVAGGGVHRDTRRTGPRAMLRGRSGRGPRRRRRFGPRRQANGVAMSTGGYVLFICVHNAGRSMMAEAMFNAAAPTGWSARSAGTSPAETPNPRTASMLREIGLDLPDHPPRLLEPGEMEGAALRITMGCLDDASCPARLKHLPLRDWGLPDPSNEDDAGFRRVRDELQQRVATLRREIEASRGVPAPDRR